jgi:prolyl-tRNA editing enzyme YbaK/EbsC (Cys-tRNA(Pro) deacylase)
MTETDAIDIAVKAVALYAARHPRPAHVTITQAAEMLGRSRQTVSKTLVAQGIRINALGSIPIEAIDRLLVSRV